MNNKMYIVYYSLETDGKYTAVKQHFMDLIDSRPTQVIIIDDGKPSIEYFMEDNQ